MVNSVTHSRVLLILATSTIVVCSEFRAVFSFILIKKNVLEKKRKRERIIEKKNLSAQRGARTHDPEIKSLMLYRLS